MAEKSYQNKKRTFYRFLLVFCCIIGLLIKTGVYFGEMKWYTLLYYANWSNFLTILLFLFLILFPECNDAKKLLHMKGGITMMMLSSYVMYHFLLGENNFTLEKLTDIEGVGSFLLYDITVFFTIFDWFFWNKKGMFSMKAPLFWTSIPCIYFIVVMWIAQKGAFIPNQNTKYPYQFMAVDLLGWSRVLTNIITLSACFIAIGYLYICLDQFLVKKADTKKTYCKKKYN